MPETLVTEGKMASTEAALSGWRSGLYRVSSVAAWMALLVFRRWLGAEFMGLRGLGIIRVGPKAIPSSALDWFQLLQAHPLIGLILLNAFDMMTFVLAGVVFLGLYAALSPSHRSSMILALALCLAAIAVYLASNPAFGMTTLSHDYFSATTDGTRTAILAKGRELIARKNPQALGQNLAFALMNVAGLIVSTAMLQSGVFSNRTAWLGILHNGIALGCPIGVALFPGNLAIAGAAWIASVSFWVFWYIGIARALWRVGRSGTLRQDVSEEGKRWT